MNQKTLEGISFPVPQLVYGTGSSQGCSTDSGAAFDCFDMAWDAGFRMFDTAYSYPNAEKNLGDWLDRRGLRASCVILDKGCNPGQAGCDDIFSADTIKQQVTESLHRLKTDWTDFYILHRDDESKPVDEIVEALNECKAKGLIRRFGGSNWKKYRIEAANQYAAAHGLTGFTAVSPNYCMADLVRDPWGGSVTISGDQGKEFREWLEETQIPVFNYSALGRGYLSGKYRTDGSAPIEACLNPAPIQEYHCPENEARLARAEQLADAKQCSVSQIALAWLFAQNMNLFPIVSPTSEAHIRDNITAEKILLSSDEIAWLSHGTKPLHSGSAHEQ